LLTNIQFSEEKSSKTEDTLPQVSKSQIHPSEGQAHRNLKIKQPEEEEDRHDAAAIDATQDYIETGLIEEEEKKHSSLHSYLETHEDSEQASEV